MSAATSWTGPRVARIPSLLDAASTHSFAPGSPGSLTGEKEKKQQCSVSNVERGLGWSGLLSHLQAMTGCEHLKDFSVLLPLAILEFCPHRSLDPRIVQKARKLVKAVRSVRI